MKTKEDIIKRATEILADSLCDCEREELMELVMNLWIKGCKPLTLKESKQIIKEYDEENDEN